MDTDHKVRIIMLGDSGVGKTALILQFCENIFNEAPNVTLSAEGYKKTILLNDIEINLELWDTAGLERYRTIIKQYFRSADGVLLVYDKTRLTTFMNVPKWLGELSELNEEASVLIVGNKADLHDQNQVMRREVEIYAREEGLEFCETSAKHKENVEEVFKKLALKALERKKFSSSCKSEVVFKSVQTETSFPSTFHLEEDSENKPKKKWKGCCKLL